MSKKISLVKHLFISLIVFWLFEFHWRLSVWIHLQNQGPCAIWDIRSKSILYSTLEKPGLPILIRFGRTYYITWWRHQMETFSALLTICAGNSLVTGESPAQRPVTRSFDVFFDLHLNKPLSKQWWGWWFETLSRSLCRHCNDTAPRLQW